MDQDSVHMQILTQYGQQVGDLVEYYEVCCLILLTWQYYLARFLGGDCIVLLSLTFLEYWKQPGNKSGSVISRSVPCSSLTYIKISSCLLKSLPIRLFHIYQH